MLCYVTKFEVSMAFRFRINCKHGTDGPTDRHTDRQTDGVQHLMRPPRKHHSHVPRRCALRACFLAHIVTRQCYVDRSFANTVAAADVVMTTASETVSKQFTSLVACVMMKFCLCYFWHV